MNTLIGLSVHDFAPLFRGPSYVFKQLGATGVGCIELVIGFKSRWCISRYVYLSRLYRMPILSVHQPIWSSLGIWFDKRSFWIAKRLGAKSITCHPIPRVSMESPRMQKYLQKLAAMQAQTGVRVLLENMPLHYNHRLLRTLFPLAGDASNIHAIIQAADKHNLGITIDTDHLQLEEFHNAPWFKDALPLVGNIHMSSFSKTKSHLPLDRGVFSAKKCFGHLETVRYAGQLTLEINFPHAITARQYDFLAIKRSVDILREQNGR